MYDIHDTWEVDVAASKRRGRLVLNRPWWAITGEDYLFVPFALGITFSGVLGFTLSGWFRLGSLLATAFGMLALLAGLRGVQSNRQRCLPNSHQPRIFGHLGSYNCRHL